jgi:long-chain fatty acid transport protein
MMKFLRGSLFGVFGVLLMTGSSLAGGLYLYEIGSPDVGLAAAGYAARAQDAATVFTNPAGMTRLQQPSLMAGVMPMYTYIDFSADGNTSHEARLLPGGGSADDGDSNEWLPAGGLFYVHPVNDKLALGLALTGNFGLALDYQDDWVGRYYVQEATLQAAGIQPAVAFKVNDQLSVGAGVAVLYGILDEEVAVNNKLFGAYPDGQLKVEDEDWTVQFNLGVLYEPVKGTRIGLTYLSEADLDFEDRVELTGLDPALQALLHGGGQKLDLGLSIPQALMLSLYHDVKDRVALMANLGWQDWSQFGKVNVGLTGDRVNVDTTTDLDYDDTWHVALGAQYRISEPLLLSAGIAYDSAMQDEDQVTPALPVGETWRFGLGSRYDWSKDLTLGAAYGLAWGGDLDMDVERGPLAGRVSGTYEGLAIHFVSLNAEWRF